RGDPRRRAAPPRAPHRLPARDPHRRARAWCRERTGPRGAGRDGCLRPRRRGAPRGGPEVRPVLDLEPRRRAGGGAPGAVGAVPAGHPRGRRPMTLVLGLAALIFVADQVTKKAALVRLDPARPVVVIPDFFHLVLVMNPGVAFGIFAGVPPRWRWIVTLFSLTALALLASLAFRV